MAETSFPDIFARISDGTASAARIPITATVATSSISVKPCELESAGGLGWPWNLMTSRKKKDARCRGHPKLRIDPACY